MNTDDLKLMQDLAKVKDRIELLIEELRMLKRKRGVIKTSINKKYKYYIKKKHEIES